VRHPQEAHSYHHHQLEAALAAKMPARASRADAGLHQIIIDTPGNPELAGILADLKITLRRPEVRHFDVPPAASESVCEHAERPAALGEGRGLEAAQWLIRRNWESSLSRLRQTMTVKMDVEPAAPERADWAAAERPNGVEVAE
jgi:DNA-binding GntR family transcriptional regulator